MERLKFEEQFKKQLESREIQPSSKSWEQLRSRLDTEDKKNKTAYWWLGIAASFTAGVLLVSLFFNNSDNIEMPVIVDNLQERQQNIEVVSREPEIQEILMQETGVQEIKVINDKKQKQLLKEEKENKEILVAVSEIKEDALLERKIEEIIAEISQKGQDKDSVTDAEVDALLAIATEQIIKERIFKNSNETISATALLEDVEYELDQSFREKIFEMLKNGYLKTKDAVANRND